jgi:hypothetical protein
MSAKLDENPAISKRRQRKSFHREMMLSNLNYNHVNFSVKVCKSKMAA